MKKIISFALLITLGLVFFQCKNSNNQQIADAEARARAAQAKLDSIERANRQPTPEERQKAKQDMEEGKMPSVSIKERGKVNPVDQGQISPSFRDFRRGLIKAAENKDVSYLMERVSDKIKYNFTEDGGKEGFKQAWGLDTNSTESELWQELNKILALGGNFEDPEETIFTAPYVHTTFAQGYDPNEYAVVTGQGVRMREKASRSSRNLGVLSYDIVRLLPNPNPRRERIGKERHPWIKVQTESGMEGYVYGKYVHSPVDYRASFEKEGDDWKMFVFLKGSEADTVESEAQSTTDSL